MKRRWIRCGFLTVLLVGFGDLAGLHAQMAPLDILEERGLIKDGKYFLIKEDCLFIPKLNRVQPLMVQLEKQMTDIDAYYTFEAETQGLDDYRIRLGAQIDSLALELRRVLATNNPSRNYVAQLRQNLNASEQELVQVQANLAQRVKRLRTPLQKAQMADQFQAIRQQFLEALNDLRPEFEAILVAYAQLKDDSTVKGAIRDLSTKAKAGLQLGPSPGFVRAARRVKEAEGWVLPSAPTRKARGKGSNSKRKGSPRAGRPMPAPDRDENVPAPPVPVTGEGPQGASF